MDIETLAMGITVLAQMQQYPHPALKKFAGYVHHHAEWIPDYPAWQAAGA